MKVGAVPCTRVGMEFSQLQKGKSVSLDYVGSQFVYSLMLYFRSTELSQSLIFADKYCLFTSVI